MEFSYLRTTLVGLLRYAQPQWLVAAAASAYSLKEIFDFLSIRLRIYEVHVKDIDITSLSIIIYFGIAAFSALKETIRPSPESKILQRIEVVEEAMKSMALSKAEQASIRRYIVKRLAESITVSPRTEQINSINDDLDKIITNLKPRVD